MPGHHISRDEMSKNVKTLEDLIKTHSVIYLLMDTRESRNLELFFTWIKTISFYINCFIRAPFFDKYKYFFMQTAQFQIIFSDRNFPPGATESIQIRHKSEYEIWNIIFAPFLNWISPELSVSPSVQNQKKNRFVKKWVQAWRQLFKTYFPI